METDLMLSPLPAPHGGVEEVGRLASRIAEERLLRRWRMLAERIERYSEAAAAAYRQAAVDLEEEMGRQGPREDLLRGFVAAVAESVRAELRATRQ